MSIPKKSVVYSNPISISKSWNFPVDYNDHFETPFIAYEDLTPFLDIIAQRLGKHRSSLAIYDPFWCQGRMIEHLGVLGFSNVINRNRDFYGDVANGNIPDYDVLVTNPPYSGDHKARLLQFISNPLGNPKPFALLLPVYTATKSYWREFVNSTINVTSLAAAPHCSSSSTVSSSSILYFLPSESYQFTHPENTGKDVPPFYSAWFIGVWKSDRNKTVHANVSGKIGGANCSSSSSNGGGNRGEASALISSQDFISRVKTALIQGCVEEAPAPASLSCSHSTFSQRDAVDDKGRISVKSDSKKRLYLNEDIQNKNHDNGIAKKSKVFSQSPTTSTAATWEATHSVRKQKMVAVSIDELVQNGFVVEKRPNPKMRKKLAKKKQRSLEALSASIGSVRHSSAEALRKRKRF